MTKAPDRTGVTDAQARKTALLVASMLLLIAAWNFYRGRINVVAIFGGLGVAFTILGLMLPALARPFHTYWMKLAAILGYVNSRVLLSLMFYGVFTPYGFLSRLVGRDPLKRRDRKRESYWTPRRNTRQPREQFERMF